MHCKTTNLYHQKIILHVILMLFLKLLSTHTHTQCTSIYFSIWFYIKLWITMLLLVSKILTQLSWIMINHVCHLSFSLIPDVMIVAGFDMYNCCDNCRSCYPYNQSCYKSALVVITWVQLPQGEGWTDGL